MMSWCVVRQWCQLPTDVLVMKHLSLWFFFLSPVTKTPTPGTDTRLSPNLWIFFLEFHLKSSRMHKTLLLVCLIILALQYDTPTLLKIL